MKYTMKKPVAVAMAKELTDCMHGYQFHGDRRIVKFTVEKYGAGWGVALHWEYVDRPDIGVLGPSGFVGISSAGGIRLPLL